MCGKGEAKVSLRKRGDHTPEGGSDFRGKSRFKFNRDESAFMEVDVKVGSIGEVIEKFLKVSRVLRNVTNDDKSIICILKNRAQKVVNDTSQTYL
jgi:hypothetical protein